MTVKYSKYLYMFCSYSLWVWNWRSFDQQFVKVTSWLKWWEDKWGSDILSWRKIPVMSWGLWLSCWPPSFQPFSPTFRNCFFGVVWNPQRWRTKVLKFTVYNYGPVFVPAFVVGGSWGVCVNWGGGGRLVFILNLCCDFVFLTVLSC